MVATGVPDSSDPGIADDPAAGPLDPVDLARNAMDEAREAVDRARGAIDAERGRISRELHDIVSHSVTVMVLQAAGAERILDFDQDRARTALQQIEKVGAQAMDELGRMLRVLRAEPAVEPPGTRSSPQVIRFSLADVGDLVAETRSAGLDVDLVEDGVPGRVDPSVSLTAYRVVQEGLTNAAKHSGGPVVVRLHWSELLRVEVVNQPGPGHAPQFGLATGHGLLGLRERVAVIGGTLEAHPLADGGFSVCATLPLCRRAVAGEPLAPADEPLARAPLPGN